MYVPNHFRIPDDELARLLAEARGGNLITVHRDGPKASYVPLHLTQRAGQRVLVTHLVRNNPSAREEVIADGLAIIDVTDAYVSPAWYATNEQLPNVPTWDYVTVHLWGKVSIDHSPEGALKAATELTERMGEQWCLDKVGQEKLEKMARAIVAVEMTVDRVEAKAKMSQNRHPDDIRSLLAHFEQHGPAELADYLRRVSLPYAEQRFELIEQTRARNELRAFGKGEP